MFEEWFKVSMDYSWSIQFMKTLINELSLYDRQRSSRIPYLLNKVLAHVQPIKKEILTVSVDGPNTSIADNALELFNVLCPNSIPNGKVGYDNFPLVFGIFGNRWTAMEEEKPEMKYPLLII